MFAGTAEMKSRGLLDGVQVLRRPVSFFESGVGCTLVTEAIDNLPAQPVVSVPLSALGAPPFKVK